MFVKQDDDTMKPKDVNLTGKNQDEWNYHPSEDFGPESPLKHEPELNTSTRMNVLTSSRESMTSQRKLIAKEPARPLERAQTMAK
jgi:hypothetical protein